LYLWQGLSSYGGFIGALIGIILWKYLEWLPKDEEGEGRPLIGRLWIRPQKLPLLPFADIVLSVFPIAWIFGRGGCSIVHDHPGAVACGPASFGKIDCAHAPMLAVQYPTSGQLHADAMWEVIHGSQPRWDIGLLEWMFTVCLSMLIVLTWKKKLPTGAYVCIVAFTYAPVRFVMDFLRITTQERSDADLRYGSLTFAQYCCIALFVFGGAVYWYIRQNQQKGFDPATLVMEPPDEDEEPEAARAKT
jgi:phosphatidylglycerol:prolipoprotein diacylglycerol transferase